MSLDEIIENGKEKVRQGYVKEQFNSLNDRIFEILGNSDADYYGMDTIDNIKAKFDDENDIYEMLFYKYINNKLVECSYEEAINTSQYKENNIFIFSQIEDDTRKEYVALIINNY